MTQVQYLTEEQIQGLINIIRRDHINPMVSDRIKEIKASDEFNKALAEYKESEEYKKVLTDAETKYNNNLKIHSLYQQIKEISKQEFDYCNRSSHLASYSIEDIEISYESALSYIENTAKSPVAMKLGVNLTEWGVEESIEEDLMARLRLIAAGNFDEIVKDMVSHINVDKYIYTK